MAASIGTCGRITLLLPSHRAQNGIFGVKQAYNRLWAPLAVIAGCCILWGIWLSASPGGALLSWVNPSADWKYSWFFKTEKAKNKGLISKRDRMDLAIEQEVEMTLDPALGVVPRERLLEAMEYTRRQIHKQHGSPNRAAIPGIQWLERGPSNVGGRTRAVLLDPNDPNRRTVWAGGVAGGLWKTTDISQAQPIWTQVDDFFDNLAVTCLAADPSNTQVMYFGTGEGYFNGDAVRGLGLWKTTDGGQTWNRLGATTNPNFHYCQKIAVTSMGVVLVATRNGLWRSANGGANWTKVLGGSGVSNTIWDVKIAANGVVYAAPNGGIHMSTDQGVSFGPALTLPVTARRIELAPAPSDPNYLYALVENSNRVEAILLSTDGGTSWSVRNEPQDADPGISATDFSRGQAWYDLCIAVDPSNRNALYVGGIDLFRSTDAALNWQQVSHWYGGFGHQYVHADQHYIVYESGNSNVLYVGNDGGVYRCANASAATPIIQRKDYNYRTTQFYACDIHPDAGRDYFLAGAQDNGSQRFSGAGINQTVEVTGGDGAFCHIDQSDPAYQFTSYVYNNYRRSSNGGSNFAYINYNNNGRFINPTDYDDQVHKLYAAENNGVYLRWDNPRNGSSFTIVNAGFAHKVSAVTCDPNTANRVYFGMGTGQIYRVDDAHTNTPVVSHINAGAPTPGSGYVSCIAVEDGDPNHLLVTYSNYGVNSVWESLNGGGAWVSVEGNLPDMPVRWALFHPDSSRQAMLATELGVWSTDRLNGPATQWSPSSAGLAFTRTDMLKMRDSDRMVIAATHGRGLFSSDVFVPPVASFDVNRRVTYIGKEIQFTDYSSKAVSWVWDFGDGEQDSTQHPRHAYAQPGLYTVSLSINNGASVEVRSGFVHVLPNRGNFYPAGAGGNFEVNPLDFAAETLFGTPFERGNSNVFGKQGAFSGNFAWVTGITGNYLDNTDTRLYTPKFDLSQAGTYIFRFRSRFHTEADYDGFRVEYSFDLGDSWTPIGGVQPFWYNFANGSSNTAFPISEPYLSGDRRAGFDEYYLDVSALAGNPNVSFRFVFRSDVSVTAPGVAIDEVELNSYILPSVLLDFSGARNDAAIDLLWRISGPAPAGGFTVERSSDGRIFEYLGAVLPENSLVYRFSDPVPYTGECFYRLRLNHAEGVQSYTEVIRIGPFDKGWLFRLSPNPASDYLSVFTLYEGVFELYTLQGEPVIRLRPSPGQSVVSLAQLSAGVYLAAFTDSEGRKQVIKLLKQ